MTFPKIAESIRLGRLEPPAGRVRVVLDTDAFNEIDDQFALVYALLSPDRLSVEAIYAAPFYNRRSSGPGDGMEKSYEEILRLLDRLGKSHEGFVYKGATAYMAAPDKPCESAAAEDLVRRALASAAGDPLYVVAIGAITNVASAIAMEPSIVERITVVWLGGHALHWPHSREFNLHQDIVAARLVFDCGVPLVHVPCLGVTSHLRTTVPEIDANVRGRGAIGDYLAGIFAEFGQGAAAWSKVLWDVAAVAYLIDSRWTPSVLRSSPVITDQATWSVDHTRHLIRYVYHVERDPIFRDLFRKLDLNSEGL